MPNHSTRRAVAGRTRERTHYRLTQKGVRAVQEWLGFRSRFPRIRSEAAIRLQARDLADDASVVLGSLKPLREEIAEIAAVLDEPSAVKRSSITAGATAGSYSAS
jgi:DNA-binding PadR family transcriptional regulator